MNTASKIRYAAPPRPPLYVSLGKLLQLIQYDFKQHRNKYLTAFIFLIISCMQLYCASQIRMPFNEKQAAEQIVPNQVIQDIANLKAQLKHIKEEASSTSLALMEQSILNGYRTEEGNRSTENSAMEAAKSHIVIGYAGISSLLENLAREATKTDLSLRYKLDKPEPITSLYSDNLANIKTTILLEPQPDVAEHKVWDSIMKQLHFMLLKHQKFSLISIHASASNPKAISVTLTMNMLVSLTHKIEGMKP